jgi:hypothetical protein
MTIPVLSILAIALLSFLVIEGLKAVWRRGSEVGATGKLLLVLALNLIAAFGAFGGLHYLRENWSVILWATVLGTLATCGIHALYVGFRWMR